MKRAIVDLIVHPTEPVVLSILRADGTYERHEISRGALRNLARNAVHALCRLDDPVPEERENP